MKVDLNSDSGESFGSWIMGDDAAMARIVSSLNVACGFHAGDPDVARTTCRAAAESGAAVGAHVSYPDLQGFGRRVMDMGHDELVNSVIYQIGALQAIAAASGTRVAYVKPHGALYNHIARDEAQARAVAEGIASVSTDLPILVLPHSEIATAAETAGLRAVPEVFADRGYNSDGSLVSRREQGAVLHDADEIASRVVRMVKNGLVTAVDGSEIRVDAQSVCVHGDTPGAVEIARTIRRSLDEAGIVVESFAAA
ncbi:LamB/YcsF family protein [Rothia uropygialis]|uniref:LamB/YcsF family protein n=1 Tax=Kocuria sp. 36 TaxID=1415402 RepID=UPI00101D71B1|nr:5-oxoprolinase subunit PxpA [Kocuria sp. 36]